MSLANYTTSLEALDNLIYSTLNELMASVGCFFKNQVIELELDLKIKFIVVRPSVISLI